MYDEGYYRYRESTPDFSIEAGQILRMLETAPGARVLEVGCGGGALLSFMRGKGLRPTGSDLLPEAVRLACEAAPGCEVLEADASRLPFPDASFDRLVSHHLVEHLPDLPTALAEWKRVLAPGGVLVICTPNRLYGSPRIFEDPSHLHIYDRRELVRMVEEAGFRVEESLTIFPHLLRDRVSVKLGVPAWRLFRRLPWFRERGRTLLVKGYNQPMPYKMLIVNHAVELGGAERVLLRNLDGLDHELFTPALACPSDGPFPEEAKSRGLPVCFGHPAPRLLNIRRRSLGGSLAVLPLYAWDMAASVVRLARFIRREGFDLVLTNSAKADIYGGMAGWLARRPVAWRLHDIADSETFNRLNRFLFRAGATLFATRVLAVSEAVRQALVGLGVPAGKVVTVYNGIDLEATEKAAGDEDIRSGLGIGASAPVAGFVGRLVDWKGVDYFIRAAALVARELPEARFLVVGDVMFGEQEYADSLKPLASELGLDGRIIFTGWREDIPALVRSMDVVVHSSILAEPLATVIIEAMALGRPVVASRDGGVPEMVVEGETGLMTTPRDVEAMAAAVTAVLRDRGMAGRMGEAGKERAAALFGLEANTRRLEQELLNMMKEGRA